ncbi:hypothetical protein A2U01_0038700 [Trifolium medium]|uniref:Endonuclease/exonuclease/phosphatase family protein n=1 Tax=Trifolium medium TaxID=97028 RepID=A0A392Q0X9_9FABA|nr:hypothetical protein [Trifolium medium]
MLTSTLTECDLMDLGYQGDIFTWANNQADEYHIKERLDRFCANSNWIDSFPRNHTRPKRRIKRIEHVWMQDKDSYSIVQQAWCDPNKDSIHKLEDVLQQMHQWGNGKYGNVPRQIAKKQDQLSMLKQRVPNKECIDQIKDIERELDDMLKKEEIWWAQSEGEKHKKGG